MSTNSSNPIDVALELYFSDTTQFYATEATWINPHTSKIGTPVAGGGIVWPADNGPAVYPKFDVNFVASGETKPMRGAARLKIVPFGVSPQFTIVTKQFEAGQRSVVVPDRLFVKAADLPPDVSVRSAVSFFFVLANDELSEPMFITFKGYLSNMFINAFASYQRVFARATRIAFGKPLSISACQVEFGAGNTVMVGQKDKSPVAQPAFFPEFSVDAEKEKIEAQIRRLIVPAEKFERIKLYAGMPNALMDSNRWRVAHNLKDALIMLGQSTYHDTQVVVSPAAMSTARLAAPSNLSEQDATALTEWDVVASQSKQREHDDPFGDSIFDL